MSILSGVLAALCFPKFNLSFLAWVALVPLFLKIDHKSSPREAALSGFLFGIVFFGINLFWINTLNAFAPFFAALGYFFLVLFEAVFIAAACYLIKKFSSFSLVAAPLIWTFFEWLRSLGPFGISAGDLGLTQAANIPLIQIASFTTVFGVSFLIVLVNQAITETIDKSKPFAALKFCAVLLLTGLVYFWGASVVPKDPISKPSQKALKISIIQGNIPQNMKLSHRYNDEIVTIHENLTRSALRERPDLIIWPESVVFSYLMQDPALLPRIKKLANDSNAFLLIGSPYYDEKGHVYNSLLVISQTGEVVGRYDKQRLVAFGEYLPFRSLLYPILKITNLYYEDFDPSPGSQVLDVKGLKIGAAICFESTFVDLLRKMANKGADLLLTVTNDAWFFDSSAPYEHINNGILRAVENRRYFIQVANTGISAIIDPYGRILARTKVNERKILTIKIPLP